MDLKSARNDDGVKIMVGGERIRKKQMSVSSFVGGKLVGWMNEFVSCKTLHLID